MLLLQQNCLHNALHLLNVVVDKGIEYILLSRILMGVMCDEDVLYGKKKQSVSVFVLQKCEITILASKVEIVITKMWAAWGALVKGISVAKRLNQFLTKFLDQISYILRFCINFFRVNLKITVKLERLGGIVCRRQSQAGSAIPSHFLELMELTSRSEKHLRLYTSECNFGAPSLVQARVCGMPTRGDEANFLWFPQKN